MKKKFGKLRILSILLALMIGSMSVMTGCTEEDAKLVGDAIQLISEMATEENSSDAIISDETAITSPTKQETTAAEVPAKSEEKIAVEAPSKADIQPTVESPVSTIDESGTYDSKEDVALYIYTYGHLPDNYITKKEAEKLGWPGGSLEKYAPGKCIGGSYFGNYEQSLPVKDGRKYTECDIDTLGAKSRGAKRIVFSNDGLIYYTDDHYETFELLYGEP